MPIRNNKTWTLSKLMAHPAVLPIEQLLCDCNVQHTRGSGPGGQHRNKVHTAVVIEHLPTGVYGEASERRSQADNRRQAIHRLRINLALALREEPSGDLPQMWQQRVQGSRITVNPQHEDFPALLSIALDNLWDFELDIATTSKRLEITSSQLVKFLKLEKAAFAAVNKERIGRKGKPLR